MTSPLFYSSDIVSVTFGLKPDTSLPVWVGETCKCSHCARPIDDGEHYEQSSVGQFFSDSRDLYCSVDVGPGKRAICWRCSWLRKRPLLLGFGAAVVTKDHVYPIHKDVHKAWAFTTPPDGPFLVTHSSSTMQHLAWRTPVTLDNRLMTVRFGPNLFTVRPAAIRKALAICDAMNSGTDPWRSPLILDRKATRLNQGQLTQHGKANLAEDDAQFLSGLSSGEYWALAYLMHSKRPVPEVPEPITASILEKLNK